MYLCAHKVTCPVESLGISVMGFKRKPMDKEIKYILMEGQGWSVIEQLN